MLVVDLVSMLVVEKADLTVPWMEVEKAGHLDVCLVGD